MLKRAVSFGVRLVILGLLLLPWGAQGVASCVDDDDAACIVIDEPMLPSVPAERSAAAVRSVLAPAQRKLIGLGDGKTALRLEDIERTEVDRLLGPAQVVRWGENREQLQCYVATRPGDATVLYLLEYPEIVFEVTLLSDKRRLLQTPACLPTGTVHKGVRTAGGLRLGLRRAQVRAILGRPQWSGPDTDLYTAERDLPPRPGRDDGGTDWRKMLFRYDARGVVRLLRISWNQLE